MQIGNKEISVENCQAYAKAYGWSEDSLMSAEDFAALHIINGEIKDALINKRNQDAIAAATVSQPMEDIIV